MTEISDLRELLQVYGIDDSQYTDTQLQLLLKQARTFIGNATPENREDYVDQYHGKKYMTQYYPVSVDSVNVTVGGESVTPHHITEEGIIYFDNIVNGELSCTYTQQLSEEDISGAVLPLVVYMIQDQNGGNMSSITEGDVSVSFDNNSTVSTSNQINRLIESLRQKYKARVVLL